MTVSTSTTSTAHGHWIAGEHMPAAGERIEVVNPATEEVVAAVPAGTAADVDRAVAAARAAFRSWSVTTVEERAAVVHRISDGLRARSAEIAATITAEMGSPTTFAQKVQAVMPHTTSAGVAALAAEFPWTEEIGNSLVVREPIGVVGAITPWNYPLHQIVAKVAPALLAGCTVVLKPSEIAPLTAGIFAEIVAAAGAPAGAFNVVHGYGPTVGEAIAAHPDVDMVSFTGSGRAGRRVMAVAAETIKRVSLELGGKSANVVLPDADLNRAVKLGVAQCYMNGGQSCAAWTRMIVPADRHDEIVEMAVAAAGRHAVGDPTDATTRIGPMASAAQAQRVQGYLEKGVAEGATVALGGPGPVEGLERGCYVRPTIFAGVDPHATIAQEEIFGPVLSVLPYRDDDEAVEIVNNTVYGLGGAVFGEPGHALAIAQRLRTGQVDVNGGAFNPVAPFGGYKQSGNGRELGRFGLEEFLEVKSIQR